MVRNPIKDEIDEVSLSRGVAERDRIINTYKRFGVLDRNDAIHTIQALRLSDKEVAATTIQLAISSVPFSSATNDQIVGELIMQRDILQAKLIKLHAAEQR